MNNEECKQEIIRLITEIDNTWLLYQILRLINNMNKEKS